MSVQSVAQPIGKWDKAGMFVSCLCLIHCMLTPVALFALPALAHLADGGEWIHISLACLAIPISSYAMNKGYRAHRSPAPTIFALLGITLLWVSLLFHEPHWLESVVASFGAAILSIAHVSNHRLSCYCCQGR